MNKPLIPLKQILCEVANEHDVLIADLQSRSQDSLLVHIRREFVRRAREEGYTYKAAGRAINRVHATVRSLVTRGNK